MTGGLIAATVAGAILVGVGMAGAIAKPRLKVKYPPPGRLVDVGGYRLHLDCQGMGSPAVILDGGIGVETSLAWTRVQSGVSEFSRVCVYDRAGNGWSDASPRPRTAQVMVDELRALLGAAEIPGPYVLVAHSFGGLVSRLYASMHPEEVAGMVLLDSAHEDQMERFPQEAVANVDLEKMTGMMSLLGYFLSTGIPAIFHSKIPLQADLPDRDAATARALLASGRKVMSTMVAEQRGLVESQNQVRSAPALGDLPLIVISHGKPAPLPKSPGITPDVERRYEEVWQELQAELAALSTKGELVVARESGHAIQLDQPELVVDAVRRILDQTRTRSAAI